MGNIRVTACNATLGKVISAIDSKIASLDLACGGVLTCKLWRTLVPRFSLPRVVEAIYVQSLPHPH